MTSRRNDPHALAAAILRREFPLFFRRVFQTLDPGTPYVPNWHYLVLARALQRVMTGENRRLIINVPPRSGKSIMASVAWPMFVLGHDPTRRIICVSHTEDLARKFSIDRGTIARSHWYPRLFPRMRLNSPRPRDLELITTEHGSCFAAGVGGAILGRGADLILVDDPIKAIAALSKAERRRVTEFYDNTLLTRLNDKQKGAIVIIMQRLHEDDLVGHVLERDEWEMITLPAIAREDISYQLSERPGDLHHRRRGDVLHPAREPVETLEQIRRAQGSCCSSRSTSRLPRRPAAMRSGAIGSASTTKAQKTSSKSWFLGIRPRRWARIMIGPSEPFGGRWDSTSTCSTSCAGGWRRRISAAPSFA